MDNRAPSFLPARRVVSGELFRPDVGLLSTLAIEIRVDTVQVIVTTCRHLDEEGGTAVVTVPPGGVGE
jgi:hypothetical protein